MKRWLHKFPPIALLGRHIYSRILARRFHGSGAYWEDRYRKGRNSGSGSYGRLAQFKAGVLNRFVHENRVQTVIELGCGDGAQLSLARYPHYHGTDISPAAIERCRQRFGTDPTKTFTPAGTPRTAQYDLALSLDVIYHLVEDSVFEAYMCDLFAASNRFVIIYSCNEELAVPEPHIRYRKFTDWIGSNQPQWQLCERIANRHPFDRRRPDESSLADFYIYAKQRG